jgi:hypothetical protein
MTTNLRCVALAGAVAAMLTLSAALRPAGAQTHLVAADTTPATDKQSTTAKDPGAAATPAGGAGTSTAAAAGAAAQQGGTPASGLDFSGWVFGSYQYRTDFAPVSTCRGANLPNCHDFNQFTLDRAYLTFRAPAGNRASVRVTTDIFQNADTTKNNNGFYKGWVVRLKYAYLQYDFLKDPKTLGGFTANARIGVLHTVIIDHEELFWPRYLSQTAVERDGWFSSADLGVASTISAPNHMGEVYATITNGATDGKGYTGFASDPYKDYAGRLTVTPFGNTDGFLKTLDLSGWYFRGAINSKFSADVTPGDNGPIGTGLDRRRYGAMVGIRDRRVTAMGEYSERFDDGEFGSNTPGSPDVIFTKKQTLTDGFIIVRPFEIVTPGVKSPFGALFRFDDYRPDVSRPFLRQFLVAGAFWDPTSKTSLALDYQESKGRNGDTTPFTKTFLLQFQAYF